MDPVTGNLVHHETLGRLIRSGDWVQLSEGTLPLIRRILAGGDAKGAAELAGFFRSEMQVVYDIYTQWFRDTRRYLLDHGMSAGRLAQHEQMIVGKLLPFHSTLARDRAGTWADIGDLLDLFGDHTLPDTAKDAALQNAADLWRDLHDSEVDWLSGLFHLVVTEHGEPALRDMYEGWVIGDWFASRYQRFDISQMPWETARWLLIYLGFEGHHGHLSGTERDGTIEVSEDDEKVTISFAPCGSGGRSMEGEKRDELPPLSAGPFNWSELQDPHDFTWNERGICGYCAHCCILHETLPIAAFGYPVRVTHPPKAPLSGASRCSWTVYKDLRAVPDWAYTRVGAVKPPAHAPLGSDTQSERARIMAEADHR